MMALGLRSRQKCPHCAQELCTAAEGHLAGELADAHAVMREQHVLAGAALAALSRAHEEAAGATQARARTCMCRTCPDGILRLEEPNMCMCWLVRCLHLGGACMHMIILRRQQARLCRRDGTCMVSRRGTGSPTGKAFRQLLSACASGRQE
jgi:hypothetical protein